MPEPEKTVGWAGVSNTFAGHRMDALAGAGTRHDVASSIGI